MVKAVDKRATAIWMARYGWCVSIGMTVSITICWMAVTSFSFSLVEVVAEAVDKGASSIWVLSYGCVPVPDAKLPTNNAMRKGKADTMTIGRLSLALLLCCHAGNQQCSDLWIEFQI